MSRSCVTVRSCPHRLAGNADGDDVAGSGEAVRPRAGLVVVAGEQDAGAVAEVGAEQCRSNTEELLILVIPNLRDGLDADCVHVLLLYWLLPRRLLRNDVDRPGAMAGLHGSCMSPLCRWPGRAVHRQGGTRGCAAPVQLLSRRLTPRER